MSSVSSPYNFLEDPDLVSRLKRRSLLVIFGARGLISDGSINDADLSKRLRKLRSLVPGLKVWHLFDQPDEFAQTTQKLKSLRQELNSPPPGEEGIPRLLFVSPTKEEFESNKSNAFADALEIDRMLGADQFLALIHDAIQIDLSKGTEASEATAGLPLSPIEKILLDAMESAGLSFRPQVQLDSYILDFLVERGGRRLAVEADGREFHDSGKDAERDRIVLERHGLETLRFTGQQISRDADQCVQEIFSRLDGIKLQRAKLKDEMALDPEQAKAVAHGGGHARILAPAGSGKTKVLVSRILRLINQGRDPSCILALAFNRKAAVQLEVRLRALGVPVGGLTRGSPGVNVATLNAFAFRLLKTEGWSGEILDTKSKETGLVADALGDVGIHLGPMRGSNPIIEVLEHVNRIKRGLMPPSEEVVEVEQPNGSLKIDAERVWNSMQDLQARRHQMFFEDQIFLAVDLLLKNSKIRHQWQRRFTYILVDEFQDLNPSQSTLIRLLAAPSASLFAVGDDDQLIYSWRSAEVQNLLGGFINSYEGATTYALGTNYRCAKEIVRIGQRLIEHNKVRYPKTIEPADNAPDGTLELVASDSLTELGDELVRFVHDSKGASIRLNEIAVLARTNTQLLAAALALDKSGLPRTQLDGVQLYSTPVGKRLIAYLDTCLRAPLYIGAAYLPEVINRPNRFVTNLDIVKIRNNLDPWLAAQFIARDPEKKGMRTSALLQFLQDLDRLGPSLHDPAIPVADRVRFIVTKFNFAEQPDDKLQDREKTTDDMLIEIIIEDAKNFEDMLSFLAYAKERRDLEENEERQPTTEVGDAERINLSTIHSAKGREWSSVCLFDASRPSRRKEMNHKEIEEERRVFYVGMTRASLNLQIAVVKGRPVQFVAEALLPSSMAPTSPDEFQKLLVGATLDVDTTTSRVESLAESIVQLRQDIDRETDGSRVRAELAKLDAMAAEAERDVETARQAVAEATDLKIGGILGRALFGQVRPETKSAMMASALSMLSASQERIASISKKKDTVHKDAESRKHRFAQEHERIEKELKKTKASLGVAQQNVRDLKRAAPLFEGNV
ncbi:MAG: UvrD-helicase domain-containing protein [Marinibacterium sp.]|nr:UvrD-helicase domain-containing protein [Marinibacterium sp.]